MAWQVVIWASSRDLRAQPLQIWQRLNNKCQERYSQSLDLPIIECLQHQVGWEILNNRCYYLRDKGLAIEETITFFRNQLSLTLIWVQKECNLQPLVNNSSTLLKFRQLSPAREIDSCHLLPHRQQPHFRKGNSHLLPISKLPQNQLSLKDRTSGSRNGLITHQSTVLVTSFLTTLPGSFSMTQLKLYLTIPPWEQKICFTTMKESRFHQRKSRMSWQLTLSTSSRRIFRRKWPCYSISGHI